jgi:tetratricopeptide (TPR) repeat protein
MASEPDVTASPHPSVIAGRFHVEALLGRGGMATVYAVRDPATQRQLALKRLTVSGSGARREDLIGLFEREFLTLTQLSHPRVIEVYDYGVDDEGPYYTMELLDGGDLRKRSPLPWREACALLAGVCSSLALIHSRRLVHRDVTPANIRSSSDGEAKLIDFGAMAPMGAATSIVGTPAFVAPEVVHRLDIDGRTDLFSFGATLYFALTGQSPYPARSFAQLAELWKSAPPPPSAARPDVPEALDSLVMALLSLEPAMRPRTAFEVMQRLTAIAGIKGVEPIRVSQGYLSTPVMVGRDAPMHVLRSQMTSALAGRGGSALVTAGAGLGRTRVLDALAVEAKLLGATVLRASASAARGDASAIAKTFAHQLGDGLGDIATPKWHTALADRILQVTQRQPVAIAVDDVHAIDEASAALLATLCTQSPGARLFLAATLDTGTTQDSSVLDVLRSRSTRIDLAPLTLAQTEELLGSLFGDAQNLGLVSACVYDVAAGNPRACMDLARHLVDKGVITYESGGWNLPVKLEAGDLPGTADDVIRERIAALPPLARWLAETQAIANDAFGRDDYRLLAPDAHPNQIDRAISELLSNRVLVASGKLYSVSHRAWASALTALMNADERRKRHRALAVLYGTRLPIVGVRHLLDGGLLPEGLDRLGELHKKSGDITGVVQGAPIRSSEVAATIEKALDAALELKRPPREITDLRWLMVQFSSATDEDVYWRAAPEWLEQAKRDSGLLFWNELRDLEDDERLRRSVAAAAARYAATPAAERVYSPEEALRLLGHYVTISIAVSSRTMNLELMESLPGLLAPFAPVSPLMNVLRQNSMALGESVCRAQTEQARARWADVHEHLCKVSVAQLPYLERIRNAVAYAVGSMDVRAGRRSALAWAKLVDGDPRQRVNALYLRKVMALQMGDTEEAERYRRQAEVLSLQTLDPQMFTSTLPLELSAHTLCGDLTGIQQVLARIEPLARRSRAWKAYEELAQAQFQQLRGDPEAARAGFERSVALSAPDPGGKPRPLFAWLPATAGLIETLVALGRYEEARASGEAVLAACRTLGIGLASFEVSRALALAEAKLNDYAQATARLEAVIDQQKQLGTEGVHLGASYEARARIAIWQGDEGAFQKYATLTAREYRHGRGSALGARFERLTAEARRATNRTVPSLPDPDADVTRFGVTTSITERAIATMQSATSSSERAGRALEFLCQDRSARAGYLYLVGDDGLTLVATRGSERPPDGLLEYAREYFGQNAGETGDSTAMFTGTQMASVMATRASFRDATAIDHSPVLLTFLEDGASRYAGVAVLVGDAGSRDPQGGAALVAAVSEQLVRGDARGAA